MQPGSHPPHESLTRTIGATFTCMTALATVKQLMLIGYIRVSMAREEMISPDIQRSAITDWARRNGYRIVAWIEDLDETGRNFRRKVMRGIERIEQREAHGIAVYRYDRWGRNAVDSLANVQRVELVGGQVLSATEPLDPETAIGRYNRTNAFALAEMQSDIIGENWKAALGNRVSRGLPATGGDRFGYVRKGRVADPVEPNRFRRDVTDPGGERYEPGPKTSPVLAECYRLYVVGNGCNTILKWLNGAGFRTTRGDTFSEQTLLNVLDSGFAAGLLRIHNPDCKCKKKVAVNRCPNVLYLKGAHKPIISDKTWKDYLARRAKRRKMPPRSRETRYPLTSLIVCGHCQINMTIFYARGQSGYGYRCVTHANHRGCEEGAYIRRPIAERAVRVKLAEWSESLNTVASVARAREETVVQARDLRTDLTRKLTRIDKALSRLVRQRALDEDMPDQVFESARKELLDERSGVTEALETASEDESRNTGDFLPLVVRVMEEWDFLPPARLRDLLATLIDRVEIHRTGSRRPGRIEVIPVWDSRARTRATKLGDELFAGIIVRHCVQARPAGGRQRAEPGRQGDQHAVRLP